MREPRGATSVRLDRRGSLAPGWNVGLLSRPGRLRQPPLRSDPARRGGSRRAGSGALALALEEARYDAKQDPEQDQNRPDDIGKLKHRVQSIANAAVAGWGAVGRVASEIVDVRLPGGRDVFGCPVAWPGSMG